MRELYLTQVTHAATGMSLVTNELGTIAYYITGEMGQTGNRLKILDKSAHVLAELEQASLGFLPRFTLRVANTQVGSIGLSLQLREVLFVSGVNWLILGNLDKQRFQISKMRHQLAASIPKGDGRLTIQIADVDNEVALVLITAFLDRWQFIASGRTAPWFTFMTGREPLLGSSYRELKPSLPSHSQFVTLGTSIKSHQKRR